MSGHGDSLARDFRADLDRPRLEPRLDRTHGGEVDRWAQSFGFAAGEILDFSASINPLGPPASARQAFIKSFGDISRYPDPYGNKLKEALAARHGMNPSEILLGNGSTQLIYLLCTALRPRKGLIVGPAFSEYTNALALAGAAVRTLPLRADEGFRFSIERLIEAWEKDCDILFLATPNSVTGQLIPRAEIEKLADLAAARESFVVVDEAFIDFIEAESVKSVARENPYLIVLRSLTKYYALPGLRLGYLLGASNRVAQFAAYREPWSVNAPALGVSLACLADANFTAKTQQWLEQERRFLADHLRMIEAFQPFPSRTNFLLVKITGRDCAAVKLRAFLLRKKILIRACDSFAGLGANYFRVAVRRRADNRRLLAALKEWSAESIG
jgi:threonine-phosphate decarboxylase